jgi:transposase
LALELKYSKSMDKDQEIEQLKAALKEALTTITQLKQQVQELETRLSKDSHNSHFPPSSDRFQRQPKSLRKKSEKSSGGQKDHPGKHLMMVSPPDHVIVHTPVICTSCQHDLSREPIEKMSRRQVFDLPVPHLLVSEHQAHSKRCPRCHMRTTADFPEDVTAPVQYGPTIQAIGVYLSQMQLLPNERVCQVMEDLLAVPISSGSLHNWIARCEQQLRPVENQIKTALQQEAVIHQDETGLYVAGQRYWMHVACTSRLTHYAVHEKRGREAMDAIGIAPAFHGISVHDGWASYQGYLYEHALCNVHHLRELTFLEEELQQPWAAELKELLLQMKETVEGAKQRGQSALSPSVIQEFEAQYGAWLRQADVLNPPDPPPQPAKRGRNKQSAVRRLWHRLRTQQNWVLAFLHNFAVPFDNSQAERDIRMMKVQQKVSGCFRSSEGASAFCRIRSYLSTMSKQGHTLLPLLEMALVGHPVSPAF